jgi:hypothetical protein
MIVRHVPSGQPESIATNRLIASRKSNGQFKSDLSNALLKLSGSSGQSGLRRLKPLSHQRRRRSR